MSTNRTLIESALLDLKTKMAEMAKKEEELKKQLKESTEVEPDQILIGRKLFVRNEEGLYFNADMSIEFCRRQNGLWRCYVGFIQKLPRQCTSFGRKKGKR